MKHLCIPGSKAFYFEKIKENFDGSALYFEHALKHLEEKNVLINFENRLLIKGNGAVVLPSTLQALLKSRLKHLSKNMDASMILAYSTYLGARLDFNLLIKLGIKDVENAVKTLLLCLLWASFLCSKKNTFYSGKTLSLQWLPVIMTRILRTV